MSYLIGCAIIAAIAALISHTWNKLKQEAKDEAQIAVQNEDREQTLANISNDVQSVQEKEKAYVAQINEFIDGGKHPNNASKPNGDGSGNGV